MWKANGRTTDAYPWQKLTWPMARWAKNNQSVFLFQLLQFDYEIWEIIIYFTTCFSFWRLFYSLPTFCTKYLEIGPLADIFFSVEDYTNMSYYNCCGIRPKHSNISKRVGEGVITICVVLWIHFYSWYTNFRGCQQTTNLNVRRKMTIWFPFAAEQGFDNTNVCSHVDNSTLLHDVIVMHVLWI